MTCSHITIEKLDQFVCNLLIASGVNASQAEVVSKILVWCDSIGRVNHGLSRLPIMLKRLSLHLVNGHCRPQFTHKSPALGLIDGDRGFGQYVGHIAMLQTLDLAEEEGIALVGVHNSNHFGAGAYYVQLAAERDMIGIAMSNSFPKVAPHGGIKPVFGTNPFAFGAPLQDGQSILLDMATSARAGSTVCKYIEAGQNLPDGVAVDAEGRPVVDMKSTNSFTLLPFGGAKGYGLALMIEVFSGVITGAGISHQVASMYNNFKKSGNNGHTFIAINIEKLLSLDMYFDRMELLTKLIKASIGQESDAEVLFPGELRWRNYDSSKKKGISLDQSTITALQDLGKEYQVSTSLLNSTDL